MTLYIVHIRAFDTYVIAFAFSDSGLELPPAAQVHKMMDCLEQLSDCRDFLNEVRGEAVLMRSSVRNPDHCIFEPEMHK